MTSEFPLYIYAICRLPAAVLPPPLGIEGETILVEGEGIGAIAEPHLNLQALQADDQRLLTAVLTHDRVICELFQQMPVLPMRFGTQMTSLEKLKAHLTEHGLDYQRQIAALDSKAEYQIKLNPLDLQPGPLAEGLKGREYFLAKKQRLQDQTLAQEHQQAELDTLLTKILQAYPASHIHHPQDGAPRIFILLNREQAVALRQQAELWQSSSHYWQLTLSEALPPYHFV
jgi:hypothetical protein